MSDNERRTRLTDKVVKAATPEARRYVIWDIDKKGFGLRVETTGHKSFIVRYRANGGGRNAPRRQVRLKTKPGEVLSVDAARKLANLVLADVAYGMDPQGDIAAKRAEMTVADLCDLYFKDGVDTKKASTIATDTGRVERHIKPLLGRKLVSEVDTAAVQKFMRDVASGKTAVDVKTKARGRAIVKGGKGTASRTVGLLGGIFTFAVKQKILTENPVAGVERYPDRIGERFLNGDEFAALGRSLAAHEKDGANKAAIAIIRLLTFTGARKSEIASLTWREVDLHLSCLRLLDSKTREKIVPLGPPAIEIFRSLKQRGRTDFVFPAEVGAGHYLGTDKVWRKVRKKAGLPDLRMHDLRHSFASVALLAGDSLSIIGKLLGHKDIQTTSRYAHLADSPLRNAVKRVSGQISTAMSTQLKK